jgi:hypothetical protein
VQKDTHLQMSGGDDETEKEGQRRGGSQVVRKHQQIKATGKRGALPPNLRQTGAAFGA